MNAIEVQLQSAKTMRQRLDALTFAPPIVAVYDPLDYAWKGFEAYVRKYGGKKGRVLFLGMNPGPWGMAQTGVPFGEVALVREWLGIDETVGKPPDEHPKYPVGGFRTNQSEVSGRRLWGLFRDRFGSAEAFFAGHYVVNWCPLLFIGSATLKNGKTGVRNATPDKLSKAERDALYEICDENLRTIVDALEPAHIIGIGNFAVDRAKQALKDRSIPIGKLLHPSPSSPRSNVNWAGEATAQLIEQGIWSKE